MKALVDLFQCFWKQQQDAENGGDSSLRQVVTPVSLRQALHNFNQQEFRMGKPLISQSDHG